MIKKETMQEIMLQAVGTEVAHLRDKMTALRWKTLKEAEQAQLPETEIDAILESMDEAHWKLYGLANEIKAMSDAIHDSHRHQ